VLAAAFGIVANANASTFTGRVTSVSPTSLSVLDKELITVGLNNDTVFTRLITQKPWQADTALTAKALRVGAFVVVHVPENKGFVANWVQVGDVRAFNAVTASVAPAYTYTAEAARHLAEANTRRANPTASESKRPGSVDTAAHCERLAALGRTPAVAAPATNEAPANSEAAKHRAEAAKLRAMPNASESKRPGSPGTAAHCDRLADELEKAGK
jgi:hypothetical protein